MKTTFWQSLRRLLVRNTLAAFAATCAEYALFHLLVHALGFSPLNGTRAGCVFGGVLNFTINRLWTFKSRSSTWNEAWKYALVSLGGAEVASRLVDLAVAHTSLHVDLIWALTHVVVSVLWHLPLQRFFVFGAPRGD